jgi:hypothetical protein
MARLRWSAPSNFGYYRSEIMLEITQLNGGEIIASRYRVDRLIRAGGMGAVYLAVHLQTLRRVALKVMRREIVMDDGAHERFALEARVPSQIDSAHVVEVLDAGVDEATGHTVFGNGVAARHRTLRPLF